MKDPVFIREQIGDAWIFLETRSPLWVLSHVSFGYIILGRVHHTLFASFLCFRCFAALAFSILCRNRTGVRFDSGSELGQFDVDSGLMGILTARFRHRDNNVR